MGYARQEAERLGHDHIGAEHLLLGVVGEGTGVAAHVPLRQVLCGWQTESQPGGHLRLAMSGSGMAWLLSWSQGRQQASGSGQDDMVRTGRARGYQMRAEAQPATIDRMEFSVGTGGVACDMWLCGQLKHC